MENKEIRLYQSKRILWVILAVALACTGGIAWAVWFLLSRDLPWVIIGVGCAVGLFFVWMAVMAVVQLFNKEPLLVINEQGISGRYILPKGEMLHWEEIDKVFIYPFRFQKFIGIEVKDPEAILEKLPEGKRRLINWSRNMGYPTFSVSTGLFSMSPAEFVGVLDDFQKDRRD